MLYEVLGFYPRNASPYRQALLHKSVHRKEKGRPLDNERLEFLGDAILDAVVGDIVYHHFSRKREGFLTNVRSKLVKRDTLNSLSLAIGLDRLLVTQALNATHNSYLAGNALEALIGAIYLDRGYATCQAFVRKRLINRLIDIDKLAYQEVNFKSKLLEWCQKYRVSIEFRLIAQQNDAHHNPMFTTCIILADEAAECGEGYSKKESQQQAAKKTWQRLQRDTAFKEGMLTRCKTENCE